MEGAEPAMAAAPKANGSTDGVELALAPAVAPDAKRDVDGAGLALAAPNAKPGADGAELALADVLAPSVSGALDAAELELAVPKLKGAVDAAELCTELVLVAPSLNGDDASAGAVALRRSALANCGGVPKPAALTVPEEAAATIPPPLAMGAAPSRPQAAAEADLGALPSAGGVDCVKPRAPGAAAAPVGVSTKCGGNNGLGAGASLGADLEEERAGGVKEVGWFEPDGLCTRAHVHWCAGIVLKGREGRRGRSDKKGDE
jgi:hypothetical protein